MNAIEQAIDLAKQCVVGDWRFNNSARVEELIKHLQSLSEQRAGVVLTDKAKELLINLVAAECESAEKFKKDATGEPYEADFWRNRVELCNEILKQLGGAA